jgi:hypothetical protein
MATSSKGLKYGTGFTASLLAVWCQVLLLATISLTPLRTGVDPIGNSPICHADEGGQPVHQKPGDSRHECTLCVVCLTHASPLAIPAPGPTFLERRFIVVGRAHHAQPRAPPVLLVAAALPRGPPALT